MKQIPKTPVEFDYDLWTTEDGKCMVRVKNTGEVTEVDREVMKILRTEENRLRRSYGFDNSSEDEDGVEYPSDAVLSLDALPDDDVKSAAWLADPHDFILEIQSAALEQEFQKKLTDRERDVYDFCIHIGGSQQEYANSAGLSISRVCKIIAAIRKKAKNFF